MRRKFWMIKKKKILPFWYLVILFVIPTPFAILIISHEIPTIKPVKDKLCFPYTDPTYTNKQVYSNQFRKETYLTWILHQCKSIFQLECSYVSCRRNYPNLSRVQVTESSENRYAWSAWTTSVILPCSKDFVANYIYEAIVFSHQKLSANWK